MSQDWNVVQPLPPMPPQVPARSRRNGVPFKQANVNEPMNQLLDSLPSADAGKEAWLNYIKLQEAKPLDMAKAKEISDTTGIPINVVQQNMKESWGRMRKQLDGEVLYNDKDLQKIFADSVGFVGVAHEDIGALQYTLNTLRAVAGGFAEGVAVGTEGVGTLGKTLEQLFLKTPGALANKGAVALAGSLGASEATQKRINAYYNSITTPGDALQAGTGFIAKGWHALGTDLLDDPKNNRGFFLDVLRGAGQLGSLALMTAASGGRTAPEAVAAAGTMFRVLSADAGAMQRLSAATSTVLRSLQVDRNAMIMYGQGAGQAMQKIREYEAKGITLTEQQKQSLIIGFGALTMITEAPIFERFVNPLLRAGGKATDVVAGAAAAGGAKGVGNWLMSTGVKRTGAAAGGEFIQEGTENIGQDVLIKMFVDPNHAIDVPSAFYSSQVGGGSAGLVVGLLEATVGRRGRRHVKALEAASDLKTKLDQAIKASDLVQMRAHSNGDFREFLRNVVDSNDMPQSHVYVSSETLRQAVSALPEDVQETLRQELPETMAALETAEAQTGADVAVPVAELLAAKRDNPLFETLSQEVKTDPDGMTLKQAEQELSEGGGLRQLVADAVQKATDKAALYDDAEGIKQDMIAQITESPRKFTQVQKDTYANLIRDFYIATSSRLGIKPSELYKAYPLRVGAVQGQTKQQAAERAAQVQAARDQLKASLAEAKQPTKPVEVVEAETTPSDPPPAIQAAPDTGETLQQTETKLAQTPLPKATRETFSPSGLGNLIQTTRWAILTAADPGAVQHTPEQNEAEMMKLKADLKGHQIIEAPGVYNGIKAPSFVVFDISEKKAIELGLKYGQESIVTRRGLVHTIGEKTGQLMAEATGKVNIFKKPPSDNYTSLPEHGVSFNVEMNFFDDAPAVRTVHYAERESGRPISVSAPLGLPNWLVVQTKAPTKRMVGNSISFDPAGHLMPENMAKMDAIFAKHPTPLASVEHWNALMRELTGRDVVLVPPLVAIEYYNNPEALKAAIESSNEAQLNARKTGMTEAAKLREMYLKGEATEETTARALVWGLLSRSVGAYGQEGMFIDFLNAGGGDIIAQAVQSGVFTEADQEAFAEWASDVVRPLQAELGSAATGNISNLTAIGRVMLPKMFEMLEDGRRVLQTLHAVFADPNATTEQIREALHTHGKGLGIDNKVISFVSLILGRTDMLVLDRVQFNHLWGPTYAADVMLDNIYNGIAPAGNKLFGMAVYRALEQALGPKVAEAYADLGMADAQAGDGTLGAFHWDTWLSRSVQAISHPTNVLIPESSRLGAVGVAENKFNTYESGFVYYGNGVYSRESLDGSGVRVLNKEQLAEFKRRVADPAEGVVPKKFLVSKSDKSAWYNEDGVNKERYDAILKELSRPATSEDFQPAGPAAGRGTNTQSTPAGSVVVLGRQHQADVGQSEVRGSEGDNLRGQEAEVRYEVSANAQGGTLITGLYDAVKDPLEIYRGGEKKNLREALLSRGFKGYFIRRGGIGLLGEAVVFDSTAARDVDESFNQTDDAAEGPTVYPSSRAVYESARSGGDTELDYQAWLEQQTGSAEEAQAISNNEQLKHLASIAISEGYADVDSWADADPEGFVAAAEDWRQGASLNSRDKREGKVLGQYNPNLLNIELMKDADLSTFIHEAGHFFLDVLTDLASIENAPQELKDDAQTLLDWFGVKDIATWKKMSLKQQRVHHEKLARGFEQYAFEGTAPSKALKAAFRRMKKFMESVYTTVKEFMTAHDSSLTPEVTAVFDRLIATREEIEDAEADRYMMPDFEATNAAMEALGSRSTRDLKWGVDAIGRTLRKLQRDIQNKRIAMRNQVQAEVEMRPVYTAIKMLKEGDGKNWGVPAETIRRLGLNPADFRGMINTDPHTSWSFKAVAEALGFKGENDLIAAIISAPPIKEAVEQETAQRLLDTYGEFPTQEELREAAIDAVYNEARGKAVAAEFEALTSGNKQTVKTGKRSSVNVIAEAAKRAAAKMIGMRKIRHLKPSVYQRAAADAAAKAKKASEAGDTRAAIRFKRDQMLHTFAAVVATRASERLTKDLTYLSKFSKASVMRKMPQTYRDQITALLEQYDLRRGVSENEIERRAKFREWYAAQVEAGNTPLVPEDVLETMNKKSYKELTVDEFDDLVASIKNIEHLGVLHGKLIAGQKQREFIKTRDEIVDGIYASNKKQPGRGFNPETKWQRRLSGFKSFLAMHRKFASYLRVLGGNKDGGLLWEVLGRPMNERSVQEAVLRAKAAETFANIMVPMQKLIGSQFGGKVFIASMKEELSLDARMSVAWHWGNETGRQRILDGDGLSEAQVAEILSSLTVEQLNVVKQVWGAINSYWPMISAKEQRVTGVAPEKVDPLSFTVMSADGVEVEMPGGYFPIKYDPLKNLNVESQEAEDIAKRQLAGTISRATTRRDHVYSRVAKVDRSVRKDINVVFQHINEVIHDVTWHEWVIDANKLLGDAKFGKAVADTLGIQALRQMKNAVKDIALGDVPAQNVFEEGMNWLRNGSTVVGLGWNLVTAAFQPLGLTQSMVRVGPSWILKGIGTAFGSTVRMEGKISEMYEKSPFMKLRGQTLNRDLRDIQMRLDGKHKGVASKTYFYFIEKMQAVVDIPTWFGAYEKAMAGGNDEAAAVALADQAVRDTQGTGYIADQAGIQRGSPLLKLFTNFYNFFNTTFNLTAESVNRTDFRDPLSVGRLGVDMLMLYAVPAVLAYLIKEALRGGLPDGDDWEKKLAKELGRETISYIMGTMIGLRELSGAIQGFHAYSGPPGVRLFGELSKLYGQVEGGRWTSPTAIKAAVTSGGVLFHYPAGQVNRALSAYFSQREDLSPLAYLVGPPPKNR